MVLQGYVIYYGPLNGVYGDVQGLGAGGYRVKYDCLSLELREEALGKGFERRA